MVVRRKAIREHVEAILDEQRIERPAVPVERIAHAYGIQINRDRIDNEVSGYLLRSEEHNTVIIGVNGKHSEPRQRFTIAHELAHYMLHNGELVHVDGARTGSMLDWRGPAHTGNSEREKEANLFAAELLMPERFLRQDLRQLENIDLLEKDVLKVLAKRYEVSAQALTIRLAQLNLVDAAY